MAKTLAIVINSTNDTIQTLIDRTFCDSLGTQASLARLCDFLSAIECGTMTGATMQFTVRDTDPAIGTHATVQFTVRDTDPAIGTHGTGSVQVTISKP
jgi:hypothetical protein